MQPVAFVEESGILAGIKLRRMESGGEGRRGALSAVAGSDFTVPCDMVVKALGQTPILGLVEGTGGVRVERGRLRVDPETGATGVPGLFAGGDCISRGAEIVDAVQEGKTAARGIDRWLTDHEQASEDDET
jgi:glutamate synthase (NADPH/NADH) small chain